MGTIVSIELVEPDHPPASTPDNPPASAPDNLDADATIERAFEWFREVERRCSRFDETSELRQVSSQAGRPVRVSEIVFSATQFAVTVAEETGGAFDPAVGHAMEARGFDRHYVTGRSVSPSPAVAGASYRDIELDSVERTITLRRPLVLDLGAVAKGLAIDLAAQELAPFRNFAINAGGDLYVSGLNAGGDPWSVGIRHPRNPGETIDVLRLSDMAICTSGDYERTTAHGHHILDPREGRSADAMASATAVAPTAMLADALATAAFVLGPREGIALLERHGVGGLLLSASLERFVTRGFSGSLLPHA
jgi:thiamine biosynthesis lipoprotein